MNQALGFAHYWARGDFVSHFIVYVLLLMSVVSWYFILLKSWSSWRIRRSASAVEQFWKAPTLGDAIVMLQNVDSERVYTPLAVQSTEVVKIKKQSSASTASLSSEINLSDLLTRTLRQEMTRVSSRIESGLTLLASVGATAPFVGLFGTVWGIYHALEAVSASGTIQIDKVAGPVGEALIMTAFGLAVAIPAVLAYNAFTRVNRVTLAELDAFAHDLHAYLTTGVRVGK